MLLSPEAVEAEVKAEAAAAAGETGEMTADTRGRSNSNISSILFFCSSHNQSLLRHVFFCPFWAVTHL